jgi:hypothetical protein
MKSLINDIKDAFAELLRWQTWLVIGLILLFSLLAYMVTQIAFKTDAVLMFLNHNSSACNQMTNGVIITLFCGMMFFFLTCVLTLGEFQQYFTLKEQKANYEARRSLWWGIGWASFAVGLAVSALIFFSSFCR